jgi:hypothetical protein
MNTIEILKHHGVAIYNDGTFWVPDDVQALLADLLAIDDRPLGDRQDLFPIMLPGEYPCTPAPPPNYRGAAHRALTGLVAARCGFDVTARRVVGDAPKADADALRSIEAAGYTHEIVAAFSEHPAREALKAWALSTDEADRIFTALRDTEFGRYRLTDPKLSGAGAVAITLRDAPALLGEVMGEPDYAGMASELEAATADQRTEPASTVRIVGGRAHPAGR